MAGSANRRVRESFDMIGYVSIADLRVPAMLQANLLALKLVHFVRIRWLDIGLVLIQYIWFAEVRKN